MNPEASHPLKTELFKKAKIFEISALRPNATLENRMLQESDFDSEAHELIAFPAKIPELVAEANQKVMEALQNQFDKISVHFDTQVDL